MKTKLRLTLAAALCAASLILASCTSPDSHRSYRRDDQGLLTALASKTMKTVPVIADSGHDIIDPKLRLNWQFRGNVQGQRWFWSKDGSSWYETTRDQAPAYLQKNASLRMERMRDPHDAVQIGHVAFRN
jgi:hypothetical protein